MLSETAGGRDSFEQSIDRREIHHFVYQHVGAFGEYREFRAISRVAGDYHCSILRVEAVRISLFDRRMADQASAHLHVIVLQNDAWPREFVDGDQLSQIKSALVSNSRFDIEFKVLEKVLSHLLESWGTVSIHLHWRTSRPCVVQKNAVFEIMIR